MDETSSNRMMLSIYEGTCGQAGFDFVLWVLFFLSDFRNCV